MADSGISFGDTPISDLGGGGGIALPEGNNLEQPVIGTGASAHVAYDVAVGAGASANAQCAALGYHAISYNGSVAIGHNAIANEISQGDYGTVAIGCESKAIRGSVAIGDSANVTGEFSIGIGYNANTSYKNTITLTAGSGGTNTLKLRFFGPSSELATTNTSGKAGIGYEVVSSGLSSNTQGYISFEKLFDVVNSTSGNSVVSLPAGNNLTNPILGTGATGTGVDVVVLGKQANATMSESIAIGPNASATSTYNVAIGKYAEASGMYGVSIGQLSEASGQGSVALGNYAKAKAVNNIAIGNNSNVSYSNSITIGAWSSTAGEQSVTIGYYAANDYNDSILLQAGYNSGASSQAVKFYVYGPNSTLSSNTNSKAGIAYAVGTGSLSYLSLEDLFSKNTTSGSGTSGGVTLPDGNNLDSPIIGKGISGSGTNAVTIGQNAVTTYNSTTVGYGAAPYRGYSVSIGYQAKGGASGVALGSGAKVSESNIQYSNVIGAEATNSYSYTTLIQSGPGASNGLELYFYGPGSALATNTNNKAGMSYTSAGVTKYISLEDLFTKSTTSGSGSSSGGVTLPDGNNFDNPIIGKSITMSGTASESVAIGATAVARYASISVGYGASPSGDYSIVIGHNSSGSSSSVVVGNSASSTASGIAIGYNAKASNTSSIAIGGSVSGTYSIELGKNSSTTGANAITLGYSVTNSNKDTAQIRVGTSTTSLDFYVYGPSSPLSTNTSSKAGMGYKVGSSTAKYISFEDLFNKTTTSGSGSSSSGGSDSGVTLPANNNFTQPALGTGISVSSDSTSSVILGQNATIDAQYSVVIGRSAALSAATSISAPNNVNPIVLNLLNRGTIIGDAAKGSGSESTAIGAAAASASLATAVGRSAKASGNSSVAIGYTSTASGSSSIAIGRNTAVSGSNSVGIGPYATHSISDAALIKVGSGETAASLYFYGPNSSLASNTNKKAGMAYSVGSSSGITGKYISLEDLFTKATSSSGSSGSNIPYSSTTAGSFALGKNTTAPNNGILIGTNITTNDNDTVGSVLAVGNRSSVTPGGIAIGNGVNVEGASSTVIGIGGSTKEDQVLVLSAAPYSYNNVAGDTSGKKRTQVYIIAAGSTLSSKYLDGEAGIGYCVTDTSYQSEPDRGIIASGCVKLSQLCQNTSFQPNNGAPNIIMQN